MSWPAVNPTQQPSGGGDVQRNLLRILLATSRDWGVTTTPHELRRRAPHLCSRMARSAATGVEVKTLPILIPHIRFSSINR